MIANLSSQQLRKAADLKEKIAKLEKQLVSILGNNISTLPASKPAKKRRMSAAGRAKIIAAQKARWAKVKGRKSGKPAKKSRRKMSAAGRAKIAAAAKARWAKVKAAGRKSL